MLGTIYVETTSMHLGLTSYDLTSANMQAYKLLLSSIALTFSAYCVLPSKLHWNTLLSHFQLLQIIGSKVKKICLPQSTKIIAFAVVVSSTLHVLSTFAA